MNYAPIVTTVESKGWDLYDLGPLSLGDEPWPEYRQRISPVDTLQEGATYVFVPHNAAAYDLKQAYETVQDALPCLRVNAYNNPDYDLLSRNFSPNFVAFTRLAVRSVAEGPVLVLFTPETTQQPRVDIAIVQARRAQTVFARDLGMLGRADLQRAAVRADRLAPRR